MITPVDAHNPISIKNMNEWSPKYLVFKYTHRLNDKLIQSDMYRLLDPSVRKEQDKSMNRDEGSYQLSHIYDNLFAQKLSGERRLERPFRRRLQSKPKRQH